VAVVLAGLVLLAQARAIVPALAISAAILVALVPGRRRRCWALLGLVAGVALAAGPLLDVYGATRPGARGVDEDGLRAAVLGLLGAAALVGALWGLARSVAARPTPGFARRLRAGSAASLAAVSILALAGALLGVGEPVGATADAWHEFKQLDVGAAQSSSSRFSSGGGNRYDYWRIAVEQFRDRPLEGIGAGNYDTTYFAERRTTEDVRQAHSLPLQTLGELGLVGLIALSLFVGGVLGGLVRLARDARTGQREATLAVSAGGTFLIWLLHTSVDWLHLIPGLTGIALCAAAALVAPRGVSDRPALTKGARTAIAVACCAVAALGALLVGSVVLAERDTAQARQLVVGDPRGALEEVDSALAIDDEAVEAYYVGAAAYARLDRYRAARASLLEAAAREPSDFVTWALIGDLALRRGDRAAAQSAYARASRLNPRDEALRRLARDPAAALPAAD
jgi:O-antigen ligase